MAGGLPHFLNSKTSTSNFEPIYKNLFEISVLPPIGVTGAELLLEHVISLSGFEPDKLEDTVAQTYKGAQRSFAKAKPETTAIDLTIEFSLNLNTANEMYIFQTLRSWARKIYNPLTGEQGLKKDYVGTIIVTNYNRAGEIFWRRTVHNAFIKGDSLKMLAEMNYEDSELETLSIDFKGDYFSEAIA
jgi:hypothetical protein